MAKLFGDSLGAFIGLLAILVGALYNARLNRKRDDRKMQDEAKNVAAAIGAEMAVTVEMSCARLALAASGPEGRSVGAMTMMLAPEPVGWRSAERRVGKECVSPGRSRGSPSHKK